MRAAVLLVVLAATPLLAQEETRTEKPAELAPRRLLRFLRAGDHAGLEKELDGLRAAGRFPRSFTDQVESAIDKIVENRTIAPDVDKWCAASPRSAWPFLVRGQLLTKLAWDARGSGWARDVTPDGWKVFRECLAKARVDLEAAGKLDPKLPHAPAALLPVARGIRLLPQECEAIFKKCVAIDPTFITAYTNRLNDVMPKWGGTTEGLLAFARKPVDPLPDEPALGILIVYAQDELAQRSDNRIGYMGDPDRMKEIDAAMRKAAKAYPDDISVHSTFALLGKLRGDGDLVMKSARKAAELGSAGYTSALVRMYEQQGGENEAATMLKQAALRGDPAAQARFGWYCESGKGGVERSPAEAARWYRLAAEAEEPLGVFELGRAHQFGIDTPVDLPKAIELYEKAWNLGASEGALFLGRLYKDGFSVTVEGKSLVTPDKEKSDRWLRLAASRGNADAKKMLGE